MAVKTTGTRKYLIWGSILVLAGVGGYLVYKRLKTKKAKDDCSKNGGTWDEVTKTCILPTKVDVNTNGSTNNSTNNSGNTNSSTVNPFKSKEEVKAFQQYVINTKNDKTILGTSADDGNWGPKTAIAWDKYGADYLTSKVTETPSQIVVDTKDVDLIIKLGQGPKAQKTYLQSTNQSFVKSWASSLREKFKTGKQRNGVFIWANQPYSTFTGEKLFETNPIGKTGTIKTDGFIFREPNRYSSSFKSSFNWNIGEIKALEYNSAQKLLFAYVPDNKVSDLDKWLPVGHIIFN